MAQFTPLSTFEFTSPTHTNCIKSRTACVCATPLHRHCVIMKMLVCTSGGFQVSPSHLRSGHVSTESFGNLKTTSHPSQISATNPTGSIPLPSVSYIHTAAENNALMQTKVPYCFSSGRGEIHKP